MEIYKVVFIGHREVSNFYKIEEQVYDAAYALIQSKEYVEFYVGRNGEFDILVASVIKRLQKDMGNANSCLILVLPYSVAYQEDYEKYYDEVFIPMELSRVHYKQAITKRNEWMIENADMLIMYVTEDSENSARCMKKAQEQGKRVLNLT